jgi:hypothetical protein
LSDEQKFDPFKPAAPKLPGVEHTAAHAAEAGPGILPAGAKVEEPKQPIPMWVWPAAGAAVLVLLLLAYLLLRPAETLESVPAPGTEAAPAAAAPGSPAAASGQVLPLAPEEDVATVELMSPPWSVQKFLFARGSGGTETALLVRLPSGSANSPSGYWAFSARAPFGKCDLELVKDLEVLRSEYNYRASHPMVVDPCEKIVFNPLAYGYVRGVMVRGDVVGGAGFRPPIAIEVRVTGNRIRATRIEGAQQ